MVRQSGSPTGRRTIALLGGQTVPVDHSLLNDEKYDGSADAVISMFDTALGVGDPRDPYLSAICAECAVILHRESPYGIASIIASRNAAVIR